jgi:hypothetical protein
MVLYNISNHPLDETIKRKAGRAGIETLELHNSDQLYIFLKIVVKHYKLVDNEFVEYSLIPDYVFTLRAFNSTFVDPQTGEFAESGMGEADFFINIISGMPLSIDEQTENKILQADFYERFDNYSTAQIVNWM